MNRFAPPVLLISVSGLLGFYGHAPWSWFAGPVVSLGLWVLDRKAREPSAPARARRARPTPVD